MLEWFLIVDYFAVGYYFIQIDNQKKERKKKKRKRVNDKGKFFTMKWVLLNWKVESGWFLKVDSIEVVYYFGFQLKKKKWILYIGKIFSSKKKKENLINK